MGSWTTQVNQIYAELSPPNLLDFGSNALNATWTDVDPGDASDTSFEAGDSVTTGSLTGQYVGFLTVPLVAGGTINLPVIFEDIFYRVPVPDGGAFSDYNFPTFATTADLLAAVQTTPDLPVCFYEGTHVATPTGQRPVEDLKTGDMILSADGRAVPVRFNFRQRISTCFGPADRLKLVRTRLGALGNGLPLRDLTLTADHALLIDGLLINAGALVNGDSIDYVPLAELGGSYTVYHIETEDHDMILAEGTPAETYIDYAARRSFDNYAEYVALYGEDRTIPEMTYPRISSARMLPNALRARIAPAAAA